MAHQSVFGKHTAGGLALATSAYKGDGYPGYHNEKQAPSYWSLSKVRYSIVRLD